MLHLGSPSSSGSVETSAEFADEDIRREGDRNVRGLKIFLGDFDRPNLTFQVWRKAPTFEQCVDMVLLVLRQAQVGLDVKSSGEQRHAVGIVYCFSQKECEAVSEALRSRSVRACPYHAGMSDSARDVCQDGWTAGKISVVCATIAFGLGINMPTVRAVVHFTLSKSLELYYQEVRLVFSASCFI